MHDKPVKFFLVSIVGLQLAHEAQLRWHAQSHLGLAVNSANGGASLHRHQLVLASAISRSVARVDDGREWPWSWRPLADEAVFAHGSVNALLRLDGHILGVDDHLVVADLWWTQAEVGNVIHHLLHAEAVEFGSLVLLTAIFIRQGEGERDGVAAVRRASHLNHGFFVTINNGLLVANHLQPVLEEGGLDGNEVLKVLQGNGALEKLPLLVVGEMRQDQLMRVGKEVVFVQLVADVLQSDLFADQSPCSPMAIHQSPCSIDEYGVPRVFSLVASELHAWSVVGAFSISSQGHTVQTSIAKTMETKNH